MENKKIRNFCRFVTICDFLFVLIFTVIQSFAAGIWFGLEIYLFIPIGTWAVSAALTGLLAVFLSAGFIIMVLYGAILLWREREEEKQEIYTCCQMISILLMLVILILGIVLNILGLRNLLINLLAVTGGVILAVLNAAGFRMKRKKESPQKEKLSQREVYTNEVKKAPAARKTGIEAVEGEYAGAVFPMEEGEKIIFGTQPDYCQILFLDPHISRLHCTVHYREELSKYEIVDYSKNGTYLINGDRLPSGEAYACSPGTMFSMDKQKQVFRLI